MSNEEKRSIISIISVSLVYIAYCIFVYSKYRAGVFDPVEDFRYWGTVILVLIPVQIVLNIIITILFSIGHVIATGEPDDPSVKGDERDQLIKLKANTIGYAVSGVGFLLSMISLVIGFPPFVMFNIIFLAFNLAEITGSSMQLFYYRRGF